MGLLQNHSFEDLPQDQKGSGISGLFDKQWNSKFLKDTLRLPRQIRNKLTTGFQNGFKDHPKTVGIGFNFSKASAERRWVDNPSVFSATGKVTVNVGRHAYLKGAHIYSKSGNLTLNSGTLTYDDIRNYDRSKKVGLSVNLSHSFGGPGGQTDTQKTKDAIARIGDVFKASGFGVDGSYDETDKQGITRATIGAGDINIRDKEKQAELESSGKTQKVANINRDLDKAQEITKDERKAFGVYATDTSVKHAIEAANVAGKSIGQLVDDFVDALEPDKDVKEPEKVKSLLKDALSGEVDLDKVPVCGSTRSNLGSKSNFAAFWNFFIPAAHAAGGFCVDKRDLDVAKQAYEAVIANNPEAAKRFLSRIDETFLESVVNAFEDTYRDPTRKAGKLRLELTKKFRLLIDASREANDLSVLVDMRRKNPKLFYSLLGNVNDSYLGGGYDRDLLSQALDLYEQAKQFEAGNTINRAKQAETPTWIAFYNVLKDTTSLGTVDQIYSAIANGDVSASTLLSIAAGKGLKGKAGPKKLLEGPKQQKNNSSIKEGQKPDFIVDKQGTAVRSTTSGARKDLEAAGFPGTPTTETKELGTIHRGLHGKDGPMDVRIMDGQRNGGPLKGPRVRTTDSKNPRDGVRTDGSKYRKNEPAKQRLKESHIHLEP